MVSGQRGRTPPPVPRARTPDGAPRCWPGAEFPTGGPRTQWHAAWSTQVLRKSGRIGADAAGRRGRRQAGPAHPRRHRRAAALHRRGRPACRHRRARRGAVRARRPAGARCPAAGTSGSGTPHPDAGRDPGGDRRRPGERRHLAVAGPRRGRDPGRRARRRARRRPARPRAGDAAGGGAGAPRRSSPCVEGRTDLAPGGSLGLDPLGRAGRAPGRPQDLAGLADARPPGRRPPRPAHRRRRRAPSFADAGGLGASRSWAARWRPGVAYLRALTDGGV